MAVFPEQEKVVGDIYTQAKRLKKFGTEVIDKQKERDDEELRVAYVIELMSQVKRENREPAMQNWIKKPFEKTTYIPLEDYVPNNEVSAEEAAMLMKKLDVQTDNSILKDNLSPDNDPKSLRIGFYLLGI